MSALGTRISLMVGLCAAALASGCAKSGPVCHPVRGVIQNNGQPVAEANVVFHAQGDQPAGTPRPVATTNEQGQFELTTYKTGDGAPPGKYAITVELRRQRQVGEEIVRDGPNTLSAKFAKPGTTPATYEVVSGDNEVPAIDVGR